MCGFVRLEGHIMSEVGIIVCVWWCKIVCGSVGKCMST